MATKGSATQAQTEVPAQVSEIQALYARLAAPFEVTFHDVRGGVNLTYITGEQVIRRLNEVLGFNGWSFTIKDQGINAEADEAWVHGELVVYSHAVEPHILGMLQGQENVLILVRREQFGSQKLKRKRSDGSILDIGFDFKGAATDALKKCASMIGVGLYLMAKAGGTPMETQEIHDGGGEWFLCTDVQKGPDGSDVVCGVEIVAKNFANGTQWSASEIVDKSRGVNDGKSLCFKHLKNRLTSGPSTAPTNGSAAAA